MMCATANMWSRLFLLFIFVTGPVSTAVVNEQENFCSAGEIPCDDGTCVSTDRHCDGIADCADRSDERACGTSSDAENTTRIECGRITPEGEFLTIDDRNAKRGELPWHAGIYIKNTMPYMQICGGSLVSTNVVISAAHCFWDDLQRKLTPSNYAVAVGKLYRPWNNPLDVDAQKSDVSDIRIPPRFHGSANNYQDDIALVILTTTIEYKTYVRPVCLDFDINFDMRQLQEGHIGKVAGWSLTAENGQASPVLKVVDLPYVKIEKCIAQSPPEFREYITSDKICAGYGNGTALCKGDSGGGLAFPELDRGTERFYLRGIISIAPSNGKLCNYYTLTSFTQVSKHESFIKESLL